MEHLTSSAYSTSYRAENECKEVNSSINKLIDDLGEKLQKNLIQMQEKMLLNFKQNLLDAQKNYRGLKKDRNEEIIKDKILGLKTEKERIFSEEQVKSLQMNRVYDKLKIDMKQSNQYERQLSLQIKYLNKQCIAVKKKGQVLQEEIKQYENYQIKKKSAKTQPQAEYLPKIKKRKIFLKQTDLDKGQSLAQKRAKAKAEALKEFMQLVEGEQTQLQKLIGKYDIQSYRNAWQKLNLIQKVLGDVDFKKILYKILFKKLKSPQTSLQ